jgi:AraC-like DNA-binding protein
MIARRAELAILARSGNPNPSHVHFPVFDLVRPHHGLSRLRDWIAAHGGTRLTRDLAAAIACVEPHHFSALFRRSTGLTFLEWRRKHRIACAVRAMESGEYTIHEVVSLVGYRNRRSLERAIRNATGQTPAAFLGGSIPLPPRGTLCR